MTRIEEIELILPSLYCMDVNNGSITTAELIDKMRIIMKPVGDDLTILAKRNDDKFSQKVRNLKSHNTLSARGYAIYDNRKYHITDAGREHLRHNQEALKYLLSNDFSYSDLNDNLQLVESSIVNKREIEYFDENVNITEGLKQITQAVSYQRSSKLRNKAIEYFTEHGGLNCSCCNFNFEKTYGPIGQGYIEIHHKKPIFKYATDDFSQAFKDALTNLVPLCSNCHRMIHKNRRNPLNSDDLKNIIITRQK